MDGVKILNKIETSRIFRKNFFILHGTNPQSHFPKFQKHIKCIDYKMSGIER